MRSGKIILKHLGQGRGWLDKVKNPGMSVKVCPTLLKNEILKRWGATGVEKPGLL